MLTQTQIDLLRGLVEYLTDNGFSDMLDASAEVSLFEYGMLRNPKTNKVIYCGPIDMSKAIMLDWTVISIDDVKEYLEENATDGFYSFIGSSREKELSSLGNSFLSSLIQAINQYDGYFQQSCTWDYNAETIKKVITDK